VLTGYALGLDDAEPAWSFAADVLAVFGTDAKLYTATIAARLAERIPQAYADTTPAAVASQLPALGVPVENVRERGQAPARAASGPRPRRSPHEHRYRCPTAADQPQCGWR
jgi:hypothetical protein